jgi:hypothetical protein
VDKGRTNNINARRPFPVKERNEEKVYINGDGQQFHQYQRVLLFVVPELLDLI